MTIERILQNDKSETEFFNLCRVQQGHRKVHGHITRIRENLPLTCGPNCHIHSISPTGFVERHDRRCRILSRKSLDEFIQAAPNGQAVASIRNDDGTKINGVLILSGLFPHE